MPTSIRVGEDLEPALSPPDADPDAAPGTWVRRGDLPATPLAVVPGARHARWEAWSRRRRQAWEWRRLRHLCGDRIGLAVDLGCGYGDWSTRLTALASRVLAVDVASGFVTEAARRLAATGHGAWQTECADVRTFDNYRGADLIVLGGVLTYLDDADALEVLARARDRLASGGLVQQRDWCAVNLGRSHHHTAAGQFRAHRRPAEYRALAARAGLRVIEERSSSALHAEQLTFDTLGLHREAMTRALAPLAHMVGRLATAWATRATVAFFLRRA